MARQGPCQLPLFWSFCWAACGGGGVLKEGQAPQSIGTTLLLPDFSCDQAGVVGSHCRAGQQGREAAGPLVPDQRAHQGSCHILKCLRHVSALRFTQGAPAGAMPPAPTPQSLGL